MKKKRVILVRTSPIERDINRLNKEIPVLKRAGYLVTLLCWERQGRSHPGASPAAEAKPDKEIRVIFRAPSGIRILFFLPVWWCIELFWLIVEKWDLVHTIDFDSVVPAAIISKLKRKPLIYEILETYEDEILLPRIIRNAAIKIDRLFVHLASRVVLADEMQIEELGGIAESKVVIMYDSPPDVFNVSGARAENDTFTLFYDGIIHKARRLNIDKVLAAISSIEGVKLIMTGYGDQVSEIKKLSAAMPEKIQFLGWISYSEVLERTLAADLLFVFPDPIIPMNQYIGGSKLLKAMMCGCPVLANKGTLAARRVHENNCGLVIDASDVEEIRKAVVKLKEDPKLCQELGANGRRAYEQRYGWRTMEQRLATVYRELLMSDEGGEGT